MKELRNMYEKGEVCFVFKKSPGDLLGLWLYWVCKTKPSIFNLFGFLFYLYWIISNDFTWIIVIAYLSITRSWWFLVLWGFRYISWRITNEIVKRLLISDLFRSRELFDELLENGVTYVKKLSVD